MMIFSEELLKSLSDDPLSGVKQVIRITRENLVTDSNEWHESDHNTFMEAYALLVELVASNLIQIGMPEFAITGDCTVDCRNINQWINAIDFRLTSESAKLKLESLRSRFKTSLGTAFYYEFSQGDLEKIQALINQLRNLIAEPNRFEKDHQQRLLKRLERLQSELHKRVSDLDKFWGLIGDAGVVMGKFGKDAKPFVDRIKEIADIVWRTQSRAEELPSGTSIPVLEDKDDEAD